MRWSKLNLINYNVFVRLHLPLLSLCFNFSIFYASCKDLLSVRLTADYLMTAWHTQRLVLRGWSGVEWTEESSVVVSRRRGRQGGHTDQARPQVNHC